MGKSKLFAQPILHRPLQSVAIAQVAGPLEITAGFSGFFQLEIGQTPIQMGLGVFRLDFQTLIKISLGLRVLIQGVVGIAAIVVCLGIFRLDPDGLAEVVNGLLVLL